VPIITSTIRSGVIVSVARTFAPDCTCVSRKQYAYQLTDSGRTTDIETIPKKQKVMRSVLSALQVADQLTETELDSIFEQVPAKRLKRLLMQV